MSIVSPAQTRVNLGVRRRTYRCFERVDEFLQQRGLIRNTCGTSSRLRTQTDCIGAIPSQMPPVRSLTPQDQWRRLRAIIGSELVYNAFGISSLPIDTPATFHYATGLETIGTLANLLMSGGVHRQFADNIDCALTESRTFLDNAFLRDYGSAEAYSCREPWCDWFLGERVLDETILLGNRNDWWLLAVTGTD